MASEPEFFSKLVDIQSPEWLWCVGGWVLLFPRPPACRAWLWCMMAGTSAGSGPLLLLQIRHL